MSNFAVEVVRLDDVTVHPNADALELAVIGGYHAVVQKDLHKSGDLVVYVPEGAVLPEAALEHFGFTGKLGGKQKNRVKAIRLRGELSQGLVLPLREVLIYTKTLGSGLYLVREVESPEEISEINIHWNDILVANITDEQLAVFVGFDFASVLGIEKYEEPIPVEMAGRARPRPSWFPTYTDLENIKKFNRVFIPGEEVVITEKLHGTNFGVGMAEDGEMLVSSRRMILERDENNLYWRAAIQNNLENKLRTLLSVTGAKTVILWGEIVGHGVQDLAYGHLPGSIGFRYFDLQLDGVYQDDEILNSPIFQHVMEPVERVPVLYRGPFDEQIVQDFTDGRESLSNSHVREGVVIKPVVEREGGRGLKRVALKSISGDYLLRKGGTERH